MSVESKHAYRFGFLRSEFWANLRLEKFIQSGMACTICGEEDFHNDAHHIFYRKQWKATQLSDLAVLCRCCHKRVHELMAVKGLTKKESLRVFELVKIRVRIELDKSMPLLERMEKAWVIMNPASQIQFKSLVSRMFKIAAKVSTSGPSPFIKGFRERLKAAAQDGRKSAKGLETHLKTHPIKGQILKKEPQPPRIRHPRSAECRALINRLFSVAVSIRKKHGVNLLIDLREKLRVDKATTIA